MRFIERHQQAENPFEKMKVCVLGFSEFDSSVSLTPNFSWVYWSLDISLAKVQQRNGG